MQLCVSGEGARSTMPYTVNVALFDFAGFFSSALPTMTGTIFSGYSISTATSAAGTMTLAFTSAAVPPTDDSAMLIRETTIPGDLFRSGTIGAYPSSPATVTIITAPIATIPAASLNTAAARKIPATMTIPLGAQILAGFVSGGMVIPLTLTIASVSITTSPPITLTATGTFVARQGIFFLITHAFTLTVTFAAGPSSDAWEASRVLSVTAATATMTATGMPGIGTSTIAPYIGDAIASALETAVNDSIVDLVPNELAKLGLMMTTTAQISALRLIIAGSGLGLALVFGDRFGPALVPMPGELSINVTPQPEAKKQHTYVFTITNSANGAAVVGAIAVLTNYDTQGKAIVSSNTSGTNGQVTFMATLRSKVVEISSHSTEGFDSIESPPTLQVSASGFSSAVIALL